MDRLRQNVRDVYGKQGSEWLLSLPDRLARASAIWNIQIDAPLTELSYNYVAPAILADGRPIILKASFPGNHTFVREVAALRHYAGRGIAGLIAVDETEGLLLLERLRPGVQLASLAADEQATLIAAQVIKALLRPAPEPPQPFPTAASHARQLDTLRAAFAGGTGPFPQRLVEQAETLFRELLASSGPPMLIHADLQHYNILADGDSWRAIDPQGVIAEAEYEVGALLRNPVHQLHTLGDFTKLTERRVAILSEALGFERQRIASWGMAQAILSAWWSYEDHGQPESVWLSIAEILAQIAI